MIILVFSVRGRDNTRCCMFYELYCEVFLDRKFFITVQLMGLHHSAGQNID